MDSLGVKLRGTTADAGYVVAGERASIPTATAITRRHAAISSTRSSRVRPRRRDAAITLIGNTQYQPETQDPLGLTRAQWEADPRQVDPVGTAVRYAQDDQPGAGRRCRRSAASTPNTPRARRRATAARRMIRQYLALSGIGADARRAASPTSTATSAASARASRGAPTCWDAGRRSPSAATPIGSTSTAQGFVNNNGSLGDLRRDEDDTVSKAWTATPQAEWSPWSLRSSLTAGVRSSHVRYQLRRPLHQRGQSRRQRLSARFSNTSPVVGAVWHALPDLNLYASYGQGFETPTFAEMAYNALAARASTSR